MIQGLKEAKMTADCALVTTAGLSASIRLRSDAGVAQVWASKYIFVVVRPGSPLLAATAPQSPRFVGTTIY